jgi:hypothetical protein
MTWNHVFGGIRSDVIRKKWKCCSRRTVSGVRPTAPSSGATSPSRSGSWPPIMPQSVSAARKSMAARVALEPNGENSTVCRARAHAYPNASSMHFAWCTQGALHSALHFGTWPCNPYPWTTMTFVKEKTIANTWIQDGNSEAHTHKRCSRIGQHRRSQTQRTCTRAGPTLTAGHFDFPSGLGCHRTDRSCKPSCCARHVGCWAGPLAPKGETMAGRAWSRENDAYEKATVTPLACQNSMKRKVPTSLSFPAAGRRRHRCCPCG